MEELKQNFISMDRKVAINSHGQYFTIGDVVKHEGRPDDETAVINKFTVDRQSDEVRVYTNKGHAHLDFIYK